MFSDNSLGLVCKKPWVQSSVSKNNPKTKLSNNANALFKGLLSYFQVRLYLGGLSPFHH
jgi:hypothetical protein